MQKYNEFLGEETATPNEQALKMGLEYVGFGRYEDPKSGQVTYIVQDGKLVPFNKAVKTNSYTAQSGNDFGNLGKQLTPVLQQDIVDLQKAYPPTKYDDDELSAIKQYTDGGHGSVNTVLNSLPSGIPADKIEPISPNDNTPDVVKGLDAALKKSKAPKDLTLYTPVSSGIQQDQFKPGKAIKLKGFRSTTLNIETAVSQFDPTSGGGILLQMNLRKGSKGMYIDDFSSTPGQSEFLLPRASEIKVVSGPTKLTGTYLSPDNTLDVYFYNCEVNTK